MKKLVLTSMVLLMIAAFTAPPAHALPECFKFVAFCDGLQIDTRNWPNNAQWYLWDCVNNSPMSAGTRNSPLFTNNCSGPDGRGLLWSEAGNGPGAYYFVVDLPKDGTFDMHMGSYPDGICAFNDLAYTYSMGPCGTIKGQPNATRSSVQ